MTRITYSDSIGVFLQFQTHRFRLHDTSVGELLHLFCADLEEQIAHRKYFYKSGTLVREGMIIINNSGLTGDTNNCDVSSVCIVWVCTVQRMCVHIHRFKSYGLINVRFAMNECSLFSQVEIDRRMLDFCVGLDTEFSEVVEGSHLYFPKTKFEQVPPADVQHLSLNFTQMLCTQINDFFLFRLY